ncbi:unnamed protein product [Closterium sp. Yama58-4]|nr:unnamed protein product [Closterium sp. Yama58-4]
MSSPLNNRPSSSLLSETVPPQAGPSKTSGPAGSHPTGSQYSSSLQQVISQKALSRWDSPAQALLLQSKSPPLSPALVAIPSAASPFSPHTPPVPRFAASNAAGRSQLPHLALPSPDPNQGSAARDHPMTECNEMVTIADGEQVTLKKQANPTEPVAAVGRESQQLSATSSEPTNPIDCTSPNGKRKRQAESRDCCDAHSPPAPPVAAPAAAAVTSASGSGAGLSGPMDTGSDGQPPVDTPSRDVDLKPAPLMDSPSPVQLAPLLNSPPLHSHHPEQQQQQHSYIYSGPAPQCADGPLCTSWSAKKICSELPLQRQIQSQIQSQNQSQIQSQAQAPCSTNPMQHQAQPAQGPPPPQQPNPPTNQQPNLQQQSQPFAPAPPSFPASSGGGDGGGGRWKPIQGLSFAEASVAPLPPSAEIHQRAESGPPESMLGSFSLTHSSAKASNRSAMPPKKGNFKRSFSAPRLALTKDVLPPPDGAPPPSAMDVDGGGVGSAALAPGGRTPQTGALRDPSFPPSPAPQWGVPLSPGPLTFPPSAGQQPSPKASPAAAVMAAPPVAPSPPLPATIMSPRLLPEGLGWVDRLSNIAHRKVTALSAAKPAAGAAAAAGSPAGGAGMAGRGASSRGAGETGGAGERVSCAPSESNTYFTDPGRSGTPSMSAAPSVTLGMPSQMQASPSAVSHVIGNANNADGAPRGRNQAYGARNECGMGGMSEGGGTVMDGVGPGGMDVGGGVSSPYRGGNALGQPRGYGAPPFPGAINTPVASTPPTHPRPPHFHLSPAPLPHADVDYMMGGGAEMVGATWTDAGLATVHDLELQELEVLEWLPDNDGGMGGSMGGMDGAGGMGGEEDFFSPLHVSGGAMGMGGMGDGEPAYGYQAGGGDARERVKEEDGERIGMRSESQWAARGDGVRRQDGNKDGDGNGDGDGDALVCGGGMGGDGEEEGGGMGDTVVVCRSGSMLLSAPNTTVAGGGVWWFGACGGVWWFSVAGGGVWLLVQLWLWLWCMAGAARRVASGCAGGGVWLVRLEWTPESALAVVRGVLQTPPSSKGHGHAYIKASLHSIKFPYAPVLGVLIGKVRGDSSGGGSGGKNGSGGAADAESSGGSTGKMEVEVEDAVPLFHGCLLLPMLELALMQAEEYAVSRGMVVVGVYAANERVDAPELAPGTRRVADCVAKHCPPACCLLLDPKVMQQLLGTGTGGQAGAAGEAESKSAAPVEAHHAFKLYTCDSARVWRYQKPAVAGGSTSAATMRVRPATVAGILQSYLEEGRQWRLCDFEEHLDDVSRDWRNIEVMDGKRSHVFSGLFAIGLLSYVPWYYMTAGKKQLSHSDYMAMQEKERMRKQRFSTAPVHDDPPAAAAPSPASSQ